MTVADLLPPATVNKIRQAVLPRAPLPGCRCAICAALTPLPRPCRPSDPEWPVLLRLAQEVW